MGGSISYKYLQPSNTPQNKKSTKSVIFPKNNRYNKKNIEYAKHL